MEAETTPEAATNGVATNGMEGATMPVTATAAPEVMAGVAATANRWEEANNAVERASEEEAAEASASADAANIVYMNEVRSKRRI